jgi:hypothetical protein
LIESQGVPAEQWFVIFRLPALGQFHALDNHLVGRSVMKHPVGAGLNREPHMDEAAGAVPLVDDVLREGYFIFQGSHMWFGSI